MVKFLVEPHKEDELKISSYIKDDVVHASQTINLKDFEVQDSYSDTGLLPCSGDGVLQIRKFGNLTQVAYQIAPRISIIRTSSYPVPFLNKKTPMGRGTVASRVSQPWIILLFMFADNNLIGGRMFYSPDPIINSDQQLYHTNLPNTVSYHYGNTSLGWICLYRRGTERDFTSALKNAIGRACGGEGYNANMSSIDGSALYNRFHDVPGMRNILEWEAKTKEDPDFVLREENLFPINVDHPNSQSGLAWGEPVIVDSSGEKANSLANGYSRITQQSRKEYIKGLRGVPLTYGIALYGTACYIYCAVDALNLEWQRRTGLDKILPQSPFHSTGKNQGRGKIPHNPLNIPGIASNLDSIIRSRTIPTPNVTSNVQPYLISLENMPKSFAQFKTGLPKGTKCAFSGEEIGLKDYIRISNNRYVLEEHKDQLETCVITEQFYLLNEIKWLPVFECWVSEQSLLNYELCDRCNSPYECTINGHEISECTCNWEVFDKSINESVAFDEDDLPLLNGKVVQRKRAVKKRAAKPAPKPVTTLNNITITFANDDVFNNNF